MAIYCDETGYPGMIYPWLGTLRLLNGLAHPDALVMLVLAPNIDLQSSLGPV
jgi:hypothetical protein